MLSFFLKVLFIHYVPCLSRREIALRLERCGQLRALQREYLGAGVAMELGTLGGCGAALGQMGKAGAGYPPEATRTQGGLGRTKV